MTNNLEASNQVEWNLSSGIVGEIQSLLGISNRAYVSGNLSKAFWCLKAVKFRFIQSLDTKERKELRKLEKEFLGAINSRKKNEMAYYYEEYIELIMDNLETYGYLIPKKKDSTRIT